SRASLVIINDGRAKPWNRIDAQCRNAILSQGGKRPFVAHPAARKAITGIERHEQRRRMAGARSSRFEELAGELSPLRVLPADKFCRHRGRNIRIQSLVRSKQDSPMTTLHIDRLETWRMIGLGCDAHQRDRRQCAGNIPITLASADKSMG